MVSERPLRVLMSPYDYPGHRSIDFGWSDVTRWMGLKLLGAVIVGVVTERIAAFCGR